MSALPLRGHPPRTSRRRGGEQSFIQYLSFGLYSTACLGCFFVTYAVVLVCFLPMLHTSSSNDTGSLAGGHISPGQERIAEVASAVRRQFQRLRKGKGVTDESLLDAAKAEFDILQARMKGQAIQPINEAPDGAVDNSSDSAKRLGFVVLGMHRSGTSMLSGLLVRGAGYNVGGPLIGAHFDNEKGFFERIDVVLQNDEFMEAQNIWWAAGVLNYDADKALDDKESGKIKFKEGEKGLRFLNDASNAPWLQKDPRMCITLKTWLKILNNEPAVVFTYRHPLEVAMSLKKRENNFTLERGLRLWIIYNMRAVQNSAGLCRVLSSNEAILADPLKEVQRIADELSTECGVPSPPRRIIQDDVDKFVDPALQHNKKTQDEGANEKRVLAENDGCIIREYESDYVDGTPERDRELDLYKKAMTIYCDFQNGKAYKNGYEWPALP